MGRWRGEPNGAGRNALKIEEVLQVDAQGFGYSFAPFYGRGVNAAFNEADEFHGVVRGFRELLLGESRVFTERGDPLS